MFFMNERSMASAEYTLYYQYDIAVMGEEGPVSGNFKLFFKGADMKRKGI
jgi:hypothetical protein